MSRHQRLRLALLSPVLAPLLLAAMATPAGASSAVDSSTAASADASAATAAGTAAADECVLPTRFDPADFADQPKVDNRFFPLVPGTQFVLQGTVTEPDGTHVHRVETTVTDLTKMTGGPSRRGAASRASADTPVVVVRSP